MREKLLQLMKDEGLTSSRLAEILEIQPSGISHLLSGRNKPGFELLKKILRRFPRINPDWLLLDSDQMYRNSPMKSDSVLDLDPRVSESFPHVPHREKQTVLDSQTGLSGLSDAVHPNEKMSDHSRNDVDRIILFYSDHTYESFVPKKHD